METEPTKLKTNHPYFSTLRIFQHVAMGAPFSLARLPVPWTAIRTGMFPLVFIGIVLIGYTAGFVCVNLTMGTTNSAAFYSAVNAALDVCWRLAAVDALVILGCLYVVRISIVDPLRKTTAWYAARRITCFSAAYQAIMVLLLFATYYRVFIDWCSKWSGTPGLWTMVILPRLGDTLYILSLLMVAVAAVLRILSVATGLRLETGYSRTITFGLAAIMCLDSWYILRCVHQFAWQYFAPL